MLKGNKNKKIFVIVFVILILVILLGLLLWFLFFHKSSNEPNSDDITDNKEIQEVEPTEAENMYQSLIQNCSGALVWNLNLGDEIQIDNLDNTSACQNDNHYSKMIGYTYDVDGNVIIHVNVLKRVENQLFKIDDTPVGEFHEESINDLLEQGTTYQYFYKKEGDNYKLFKVDLMEPAV